MNNQNRQEFEEKRIRAEWFQNHKAVLTPGTVGIDHPVNVEILTWRNPDTTNYLCRYIIVNNVLMVHGDIGEAVYAVGQKLTFPWLAGLELDYFSGKCCASETGRLFKGWDSRLAQQRLHERVKECAEWREGFNKVASMDQPQLAFKDEWIAWISRNVEDLGYEFCSELSNIGEVIHIRCHGHLIGIKMAMEQMQAMQAVKS